MRGPRALPKAARLLRPRDFKGVRRRGVRERADGFDLFVRSRQGPARLGLAMSRKVGSAVVRNRLKRWVREWFRHRRARLFGLDLLVVGRPGQTWPRSGVPVFVELDRAVDRLRARGVV